MPRKKTKKTKLSPAEKKDRKRLMDRARQAKKREDPDVRDKENAQKRAKWFPNETVPRLPQADFRRIKRGPVSATLSFFRGALAGA